MNISQKLFLNGLLVGASVFAHAGIITEQLDVSSTKTISTTGTNPGIVVINNGATECTGSLLGEVPVVAGAAHTSTNSGSEIAYYQVYWQQTSSGESPPTTLYAHEFLTDYAAINGSTAGTGRCMLEMSSQVSSGDAPSSADIGESGIIEEAPGSLGKAGVNAAKFVKTYSGLLWTQIGTLPSGLKIYKNTVLLKVIPASVSDVDLATATSSVTGNSGSVGCGFAVSINFLVTS